MKSDQGWTAEEAGKREKVLSAPAAGALETLRMGNIRFTSGQVRHPNRDAARRSAVAPAQNPFAVVITCSDSRVPPELIFDLGIGDLLVVRTAGHILDDIALGSVEFAVAELKVPLVLVMGHQKCEAVSAAVNAVIRGLDLPEGLGKINYELEEAVKLAKEQPGDILNNAVDANVRLMVQRLSSHEPVLSKAVQEGRLEICAARYQLDSGKVVFLSG